MEPLENKSAKALVIVEGERLEPKFFNQFTKVYGIDLELYIVGANIYDLYNQLKDYDFACDIKDLLPSVGNYVEGMDEKLQQKFAYTYLVFDFDAHHKEIGEEDLDIDTVVQNNIAKLREMASFFTNETDPTVGRLYINYPMMESYRDCSSFFDETYSNNDITIDDIPQYKRIAGQKRLASVHIGRYTRENFSDLSRMNIYKLGKISKNSWGEMSYLEYVELSAAEKILECQANRVNAERKVDVLNTALFIVLDHFGNRDGFYDSVVKSGERSTEQALQPV